MDITKIADFDQWHQISSTYNFYDMCKDIDIIHSYYHTNALQYFMAYFLLCTDKNYMYDTHPNLSNQYYIYLSNVKSGYKKEIEVKKEYYFNYALRYFFPDTIKNVFSRMPLYESFGYLIYNKENLYNYAFIEDMKKNNMIDTNEVDSFLKVLIDTFIPQLQQHRLEFKKSYIKTMINKIHSNVINMNDIDHIDFYCVCEDKAISDNDLSTQLDNYTLTFDSLKDIVEKEKFIEILYKMYFIWNLNDDLKELIKINMNLAPACILNVIFVDDNFISRLYSTLFFVITFKDGEVRLYFNTHFEGVFEIIKGTTVDDEIFGSMLNSNTNEVYRVNDFKGLPNILFDGDVDKFISEFTFYYSSVFKVINYMRHFFTYDNIKKEVLFV